MINDFMNRLYIHIPFCGSKCDYCAFHSVVPQNDEKIIQNYFCKLELDIKEQAKSVSKLESIFIGGGTPNSLSSTYLEKLFMLILNNFSISKNAEITIECNPEFLTEDKINLITNFANRISIGIQSFNQNFRKILGRLGTVINLQKMIEKIIARNIHNISIDLIYGIPGQTLKDWQDDLEKAIDLPIKHLSAYALTYEEGTTLIKNTQFNNASFSDLSAKMWKLTEDVLQKRSFTRYEVSNYAQKDRECIHNYEIWYGGKYLGLGPTASSFDGVKRWIQPELKLWLEKYPPEIDVISEVKRITEIFIMGLRTVEGWIIEEKQNGVYLKSRFQNKYSLGSADWRKILTKINQLQEKKLLVKTRLTKNTYRICATNKGLLFWNDIGTELV